MPSDKHRLDPVPQPPVSMLPPPIPPLAWRVEESYRELAQVAADLNAVSDELGKPVSDLDAVLKTLNLGVTVWTVIRSNSGEEFGQSWYVSDEIGYSKVTGKWGISLRTVTGDYQDEGGDSVEVWLFNDAPRSLRLLGIEKLPELLEKLGKEAVETTTKIKGKLAEAREVAAAVKKAAEEPKRTPQKRSPFEADREQKK
jgi:hypothetical protein